MKIQTMKDLLAGGGYTLYAKMQGCSWHKAIDFTLQEDYYKVERNTQLLIEMIEKYVDDNAGDDCGNKEFFENIQRLLR